MKTKIIEWFLTGAMKQGSIRNRLLVAFIQVKTKTILKELNMKGSWQTTCAGLLGAVGVFLANQKDPAWLGIIGQILGVVGSAWLGMAARDNGVSSEQAGAK